MSSGETSQVALQAATPEGGVRGRWGRPLAGAIALAVAVWTFPAVTPPGSASLDGAWILEINRLSQSRHSFGGEVAFTYGPLGRLLYPADVGSHLRQASMLRLAFAGAFAVVLARLMRRAAWGAVAACAAAQVAGFALGLDLRVFGFEYQLMLALPLYAWWALETGSATGLAMTSAVAVLAVFAKTTLGAGWLAAAATAAIVALLRRDWRLPVASALAVVLASAMAAWVLFRSPGDLWPWLRATTELAGGYSEAMSSFGRPELPAAGTASILAFFGLTSWLLARTSSAGLLALLYVAPLFLAYKHAFVRQDGFHTPVFFSFLAAVLGFLTLASPRGRYQAALVAGTCLAVAMAVPARYASHGGVRFPLKALSGYAGATNLISWATLSGLRRTRTDALLEPDVAAGLRAATHGSLGVVPWKLGYCFGSAIDCVPNPTLQTFAAYTSNLDLATARHYGGSSAPVFVLAGHEALDGKSVAFETPATWRTLARCYQPAAEQPVRDLLLARRSSGCLAGDVLVGRAPARFGEWIPVPPSEGPIAVVVPLDLCWAGRLMKALYRIPQVYVELSHRSGRVSRYRLVPDTARNGLPLDLVPEGPADLSRVFRSEPPADRAERIRLSGPGSRWYVEPFEVAFLSMAQPEDEHNTPNSAE